MCYISKIKRMTDVEKSKVIRTYHSASDEAVFPPEALFLVYGFSLSWLHYRKNDAKVVESLSSSQHLKKCFIKNPMLLNTSIIIGCYTRHNTYPLRRVFTVI